MGEPTITAHIDPDMAPETEKAFSEMIDLAIRAFCRPVCPKCGSSDVIDPVEKWPSWTCEPCGHDFGAALARQPEGKDVKP